MTDIPDHLNRPRRFLPEEHRSRPRPRELLRNYSSKNTVDDDFRRLQTIRKVTKKLNDEKNPDFIDLPNSECMY